MHYTLPGVWYLLRRLGWTCQMGARRAIERRLIYRLLYRGARGGLSRAGVAGA